MIEPDKDLFQGFLSRIVNTTLFPKIKIFKMALKKNLTSKNPYQDRRR